QGLLAEVIRQRIDKAAQRFDLSAVYQQDPSTLSQGQKKLLLFAICAAMNTALILLDEPSAGLAEKGIDMLRSWLIEAKQAGKIIIAAEHATSLDHLATRILHLG
ncbi:MAG: ATP-binding cassette domain-containing protein, partial [Candidatus Cloacimonadaceae bacterium]|nr:ATP-binding cassette domain-containing protein [Candidatus Cloacimonadaceae bacterium]